MTTDRRPLSLLLLHIASASPSVPCGSIRRLRDSCGFVFLCPELPTAHCPPPQFTRLSLRGSKVASFCQHSHSLGVSRTAAPAARTQSTSFAIKNRFRALRAKSKTTKVLPSPPDTRHENTLPESHMSINPRTQNIENLGNSAQTLRLYFRALDLKLFAHDSIGKTRLFQTGPRFTQSHLPVHRSYSSMSSAIPPALTATYNSAVHPPRPTHSPRATRMEQSRKQPRTTAQRQSTAGR